MKIRYKRRNFYKIIFTSKKTISDKSFVTFKLLNKRNYSVDKLDQPVFTQNRKI